MNVRNTLLGIASLYAMQFANAGITQSVGEAEAFSGGTVVADSNASGFKAVSRSSGGIYMWWQQDTTSLATGSYSVYARIALADGVTAQQTFYPEVIYGTQSLAKLTTTITNKQFAWVRLGSFVLPQVGGVLRISDYSTPGMKLDKMAIVKDSVAEAENVSGGTVVNDAAASGGRAVTRTDGGIYTWWVPAVGDLSAGDYQVFARLRSVDGAAHNFISYVALDGVASSSMNYASRSTTYEWVKLNDFTYAGGSQQIRVSDWSDPGLNVDQIVVARRTPNDQHSAAQALFAGGSAKLGSREEVYFTGTPHHGFHDINGSSIIDNIDYSTRILGQGRVSVVPGSTDGEYYIFFRQQNLYKPPSGTYQIFQGKSTDNGRTFAIDPNPAIPITGSLTTAYDPQVVKRAEGYYMVFEGVTDVCGYSSVAASKLNGATTWTVRNTPVCTTFPGDKDKGYSGSGSTPSYYVDGETGAQYLQWVSVNGWDKITTHYQASLGTAPGALFTTALHFSNDSTMSAYQIPQGVAGWESKNFGVANMYYEDGYYYMVYGGANAYNCEEHAPDGSPNTWSLGIARTRTPADKTSWVRSFNNPIQISKYTGNCWLEEPQLVPLNGQGGGLYMYFFDAAEFENATTGGLKQNRTTARKRINF